MKKVVILSAFLSPMRSGAEACAEDVPLKLSDRFDFVIITAKMRSDLPRKDLLQGKIPVVRVGLGLSIDKWLYPFLAPFAARKEKPDVVHAILETFAGLALVFSRWTVPGAKRILTCQTTNRNFLKGLIVRSPDIVTAISEHLAGIVRKLGRSDITVIPNGIDVGAFETARKKYQRIPGRILFVGRLEPMKGVDILLKAFAFLPNEYSLRIVGDGSQRTTLESLARTLNLGSRVTFVGRIDPPKLFKEYAEADVFCGFSRSEALGNVFLEAMAGGCVVVSSDIGGIREIVPDRARIDTNLSPELIAIRLMEFLTDEATRSSLRAHGASKVRSYDWSEISDRYSAHY